MTATATGVYQAWSQSTQEPQDTVRYGRASAEYDALVATVYPEAVPARLEADVQPEECAPLKADLGEVELQGDVLCIWLDLHDGPMKAVLLPEVSFVRDSRERAGTVIATLSCQKLQQVCRIRFLSPNGQEVLVVENVSR